MNRQGWPRYKHLIMEGADKMALKNLYGWMHHAKENPGSACGSACGAGKKD